MVKEEIESDFSSSGKAYVQDYALTDFFALGNRAEKALRRRLH